jgi:indole-3-glycerol phosphate synthase
VASVLDELVACSRQRADKLDVAELRAAAADAPPPLPWPQQGFVLIAEIKPASPAEGPLGPADTAAGGNLARVDAYVRGGARVISVLTEPSRFGGSLGALAAAARRAPVPVLRKDFVLAPAQVDEARAAGASAVLLLARIVPPALLAELAAQVRAYGMTPVVEVFEQSELDVIPEGVRVAVNARDLSTLSVDPTRFERLRGDIAASGMSEPHHIAHVAKLGYRSALVGRALMRAADPEALVARLVAACT